MKKWTWLIWLAIVAGAGWVLFDRLRAIDFAEVLARVQQLPVATLLLATACSAGVYALVGLYEGIAVRLATGRSLRLAAFRTALIANPIGRAIGFAIVSGGALRYRMYAAEGLRARQVAAVIVLAAMPYFFSVGWLIDLSLLFNTQRASAALQIPAGAILAIACFGVLKDIGWLVLVKLREQPVTIRGQQIRLPKMRDALVQIAFGLTQISLMTSILYVCMPDSLNMSWPEFVAIYCIAFVAGQISNVPAGLGVLEAALLLMLPQVPPAHLLGAVLAYRGVYEVLPLLVALLMLLIYELTHNSGVLRRRSLKP